MRLLSLFILILITGCVGGPTKDYYNPHITGAKYKGPVTINLVKSAKEEAEFLKSDGYKVIGSTAYSGKYPETKELIAQAKRVGASHVVYQSEYIPNPPGTWRFGFGQGGGGGSGGGGRNDVLIVFLGK